MARNLWALLQITWHLLTPWKRRSRLRWGARGDEPPESLAGEDLIRHPSWEYTYAISIASPAERVWPWIAQVGQGRGGFYSFELLENLVGCRIENADRILTQHQAVSVGDPVRLHPKAPPLHVAALEPGRSLVLRGSPQDEAQPETDNLWGFHLLDDGPEQCRLIVRGKALHGAALADRLFFSPLFLEPIGFVMNREMLYGIKERAERAAVVR